MVYLVVPFKTERLRNLEDRISCKPCLNTTVLSLKAVLETLGSQIALSRPLTPSPQANRNKLKIPDLYLAVP